MKGHPKSAVATSSISGRLSWWAGGIENAVLAAALLVMALIPVAELVGRTWFNNGIPGATEYVQHLTLWIGFLGAMVATREGKHIKIAAAANRLPKPLSLIVDCLVASVSAAVCAGLFVASLELVVAEAPGLPSWTKSIIPDLVERWLEPFGLFESGGLSTVGGWLPIWMAEAIMPLGFAVMAVRF
ncbi:MAG: TRAP transporter small permease, partial [Thermodesulfobacteriota bacterium]|nr:TRAP transporter small permease [Thermodesulfobacteriota bacterium]